MPSIKIENFSEIMCSWLKKFGRTYKFQLMFGEDVVVTTDLASIRKISVARPPHKRYVKYPGKKKEGFTHD